jgi:hypothetical protein
MQSRGIFHEARFAFGWIGKKQGNTVRYELTSVYVFLAVLSSTPHLTIHCQAFCKLACKIGQGDQ